MQAVLDGDVYCIGPIDQSGAQSINHVGELRDRVVAQFLAREPRSDKIIPANLAAQYLELALCPFLRFGGLVPKNCSVE